MAHFKSCQAAARLDDKSLSRIGRTQEQALAVSADIVSKLECFS